jgi:hypothetical protein
MVQSQHAGGMLLSPVQTLVTTMIIALWAMMQTSPASATIKTPDFERNPVFF